MKTIGRKNDGENCCLAAAGRSVSRFKFFVIFPVFIAHEKKKYKYKYIFVATVVGRFQCTPRRLDFYLL